MHGHDTVGVNSIFTRVDHVDLLKSAITEQVACIFDAVFVLVNCFLLTEDKIDHLSQLGYLFNYQVHKSSWQNCVNYQLVVLLKLLQHFDQRIREKLCVEGFSSLLCFYGQFVDRLVEQGKLVNLWVQNFDQ